MTNPQQDTSSMRATVFRWAKITPAEYKELPLGTPVRVTFPAGQSYLIGDETGNVRIERYIEEDAE